MSGAIAGTDGVLRCPWALSTEDYVSYHDEEWGRPVHGDDALYERLSLEAFQSGLSWITILRRREGFRAAFADFKIAAVAAFTETDAERLLVDAGIIRNRAKIEATLANARVLAEWAPGELDALIWSHAPSSHPVPKTLADVPPVTDESTALSKALKKKGLRFVGPTTAYALMQACGLVDDHLADCAARGRCPRARAGSGPRPGHREGRSSNSRLPRDAMHAPPSSPSRGTPTRRTGRKPKYIQYEDFRPALPQPPAGGTPRARSPKLSTSPPLSAALERGDPHEQGGPHDAARPALRADDGNLTTGPSGPGTSAAPWR